MTSGTTTAPQLPRVETACPIRAVIFDLDGTLIDTAGEIALALERTFVELGIPALPQPAVVDLIGRGIQSLVRRALQQSGAEGDSAYEAALARFETHYADVVATSAVLFPGVREGVESLAAKGFPMAVVTNKLRWFSERLLERLQLAEALVARSAGDDGLPRKPDGLSMLRAACERHGDTRRGDADARRLRQRRAGGAACRAARSLGAYPRLQRRSGRSRRWHAIGWSNR